MVGKMKFILKRGKDGALSQPWKVEDDIIGRLGCKTGLRDTCFKIVLHQHTFCDADHRDCMIGLVKAALQARRLHPAPCLANCTFTPAIHKSALDFITACQCNLKRAES